MEKLKKTIPLIALLTPGTLLMVLVFLVPFGYMLVYSFWGFVPGSYLPDKHFTLENYIRIFADPEFYYLKTYLRTLKIASISTGIILVLAYPVARFISRQKTGPKGFWLIIALMPMLGGAMIQTLGWVAVLQRGGVINGTLMALGLIKYNIAFIGTQEAIIICLIQAFLPIMLIPLVAALGSIPPSMEEAAKSLGANRFRVFFEVIFPLSLPGAIAGTILVLMANLTMFVTPSLIGVRKVQVFGTFAYQTAVLLMHWPFGSAYAITFIVLMGLLALALMKGLRYLANRATGGQIP